MNQEFDIRFTQTLDDCRALSGAFNRLTLVRPMGRYVFAFMVALMFAGAGFSYWSLEGWPLAIYFIVLAGLLLLLQFVVTPWQQRRRYIHQKLGDYEVEMKADDDGFTSRTAGSDGRQKWASVRHVDDLPEHIIFWPNNRMGWIVPKRAFASPAEAAAFANFAKEKTAGQTL